MRFALIGTRGVPARYGGFETCVEEVGRRLADRGHQVLVFCRPVDGAPRPARHLGMELVWLPALRQRQLETLSHTALSVLHPALRRVDAAIVFNAANSPLLPVLRARRIPVATHVDGLEWRRAKWGRRGQQYYRTAEALAVRWSDALIADAQGIADYYTERFGAATTQIAYGAPILTDLGSERIAELGLTPRGYHLVVAHAEPENHVLEIVQGHVASRAELPLVVVGTAPYADAYLAKIERAADAGVRLLGGVWDAELLDQLYANSASYLHGHSVGGTNPSLLRAAGAGAYVVAYDVSFNREVIGELGDFFRSPAGVGVAVERVEADPERARGIGERLRQEISRYNWDDVTDRYERLLSALANRAEVPT